MTGAVMGFDLKYSRNNPEELMAKTYNQVVEFYKQFQEKFGSILCKELSDCDLSTIEGIREFREGNVHEQKCRYFVSNAIEIQIWIRDQTNFQAYLDNITLVVER